MGRIPVARPRSSAELAARLVKSDPAVRAALVERGQWVHDIRAPGTSARAADDDPGKKCRHAQDRQQARQQAVTGGPRFQMHRRQRRDQQAGHAEQQGEAQAAPEVLTDRTRERHESRCYPIFRPSRVCEQSAQFARSAKPDWYSSGSGFGHSSRELVGCRVPSRPAFAKG